LEKGIDEENIRIPKIAEHRYSDNMQQTNAWVKPAERSLRTDWNIIFQNYLTSNEYQVL
jgi:hypothetical protein